MFVTSFKRFKLDYSLSRIFGRQTTILIGGTGVAQLISFLAAPVMSRMYTPGEYGAFAIYSGILGVLVVFATLRLDQAIQLPERDEDGFCIAIFALLIAAIASVLVFLLIQIGVVPLNLPNRLFRSEIGGVLAANLFCLSWLQIMNGWLFRHRQYRIIAKSKVFLVVISSIITIFFGQLNLGALGLAAGPVLGQFIVNLGLTSFCFYSLHHGNLLQTLCYSRLKKCLSKYRDFPTINTIHAASDAGKTALLASLLGSLFGAEALGAYSFGMRTIGSPLFLIGSATSQVFYQEAARKHSNDEEIRTLSIQMMMAHAIFLPFFVVLGLFGPFIFKEVFGQQWELAGSCMAVLTPWLYINFVVSQISQIPLILNRQRIGFLFGVTYNVLTLLPFAVRTFLEYSFRASLVWLSVIGSTYLVFYAVWLMQLTQPKSKGAIHDATA